MKRQQNTKKALFSSILSLVLCLSMLIGTTFAWFTDSVTSANNIIKSGNLDVELYYQVEGQSDWTKVGANTNVFMENALWEPGHTEVVKLKVVNEGSLALKYQLGVNIVSETGSVNVDGDPFELSDFIKFGIVEGAQTYTRDQAIAAVDATANTLKSAYNSGTTKLLPKTDNNSDCEDIVTMVVYMPTSVGNEANYAKDAVVPTINLGINLFATQVEDESDSFGNNYDKEAWHPDFVVHNVAEMETALTNGGTIQLAANITSENGFVVTKDTRINLNGHTMTATGNRAYLFTAEGDTDLTIVNGELVAQSTNGYVDGTGTSTGSSSSVYFASTGNLVMTDVKVQGSVRGGHRAVEVLYGTAQLTNVDIITSYGSGVNAGYGANVTLNNCDVTVNGMYEAPYNSVCFSVMYDATMNVNRGNYVLNNTNVYPTGASHGGWIGIIMNSGGTLNINGGYYENNAIEGFNTQYERAVFQIGSADGKSSVINLNGGTIKPQDDEVYEISSQTGTNTINLNGNKIVEKNGVYYVVSESVDHVITSAADLLALSEKKISGTYELLADIDMGGATFNAMVVARNGNASFDGNGHIISNVKVASGADDNSTEQASMFYAYSGANLKVSDLTLKNITVTTKNVDFGYAAAVVGYCEGNVTLDNVDVVKAKITASKSSGMLAGHVSGSLTASDCDVSGTINISSYESSGHYAGEYVGTVAGNTALTNCTAKVTLGGNLKSNNVGTIYGRKVSGNLTIDGGVCVATSDALNAAVRGGATIVLMEGDYELDKFAVGVTIKGVNEEKVQVNARVPIYGRLGAISVRMHFENLTLTNTISTFQDTATEADGGVSSTFTNVTFAAGFREGYGSHVVFTDCTFGSNSEGYALHFQYDPAGTQGEIKITNCVFKGGKVHLGGPRSYNFTDCKFAAGTDLQVWANATLEGCAVGNTAVSADNVATLFPNLDLSYVAIQ